MYPASCIYLFYFTPSEECQAWNEKKLELIDHLLEGKVRQLQKMYSDKVS